MAASIQQALTTRAVAPQMAALITTPAVFQTRVPAKFIVSAQRIGMALAIVAVHLVAECIGVVVDKRFFTAHIGTESVAVVAVVA